MAREFLYLVAIMDWYSRRTLAWRLSNTTDTDFCVEALEEALLRYGNLRSSIPIRAPCSPLRRLRACSSSTTSPSAWMARVAGWITSLSNGCRSLNYEEVYLKAYTSPAEARDGIGEWFRFYNTHRKHQTLNSTLDNAWFAELEFLMAA